VLNITAKREGEHCLIDITDQGCGIPEHALVRVLEPFFTTKSYGTGLGLSICASLVERNQGTMTFKSDPNVGTTITLRMPILRWTYQENQKEKLRRE